MKRLYYEVWADAIDAMKKNTQSYMSNKDKMFVTLACFSLGQGANLLLLLLITQEYIFDIYSYLPRFLFAKFYGSGAILGLVMFFFPFAILNYFLVFHKKTYLKYMENRKVNTKGLALFFYFFGSGVLVFTYIAVKMYLIN